MGPDIEFILLHFSDWHIFDLAGKKIRILGIFFIFWKIEGIKILIPYRYIYCNGMESPTLLETIGNDMETKKEIYMYI